MSQMSGVMFSFCVSSTWLVSENIFRVRASLLVIAVSQVPDCRQGLVESDRERFHELQDKSGVGILADISVSDESRSNCGLTQNSLSTSFALV